MFLVSCVKEPDVCAPGVEIIGVFTTEEKANKAKSIAEKWLTDNDFDEGVVNIGPYENDKICFYDIEMNL